MAFRPIINGNSAPFRVSVKSNYDPTRGITHSEEWHCVGDVGLEGTAALARENLAQYELTTSPKSSKITWSSNSGGGGAGGVMNIDADTWQVLSNEVHKSIFDLNLYRYLPAEGSPGSLAHVKEMVLRHENNEPIDPLTGTSYSLYQKLIHGVTEYPVGQYALKHTTNVSANSTGNRSDVNVERIYSTKALIDEITDYTLWVRPCPSRLVTKISGLAVQITNHDDYIWGWRKLPSTETTSANNRIDISTEYWLGSWSGDIYGSLI